MFRSSAIALAADSVAPSGNEDSAGGDLRVCITRCLSHTVFKSHRDGNCVNGSRSQGTDNLVRALLVSTVSEFPFHLQSRRNLMNFYSRPSLRWFFGMLAFARRGIDDSWQVRRINPRRLLN